MRAVKILFLVSLGAGTALAIACGGSTANVNGGGADGGSDSTSGGSEGGSSSGGEASVTDSPGGGGPDGSSSGGGDGGFNNPCAKCTGATPVCCLQGAGGGGANATCAANIADCPDGGFAVGCTAASCPSGQVCCASGTIGGGGNTQCESSCAAGSYQLCQHSTDCPAGEHCVGGQGIRVCIPDDAGFGFDGGGGPHPG
jgi:hypothetical protein